MEHESAINYELEELPEPYGLVLTKNALVKLPYSIGRFL